MWPPKQHRNIGHCPKLLNIDKCIIFRREEKLLLFGTVFRIKMGNSILYSCKTHYQLYYTITLDAFNKFLLSLEVLLKKKMCVGRNKITCKILLVGCRRETEKLISRKKFNFHMYATIISQNLCYQKTILSEIAV